MKKFIVPALLLLIALTSCEKKQVGPVTPAPASEAITVEYKIHAASGNFVFEYIAPDANGKPYVISGDANKTEKVFSFAWKKNETLSVKAKNYSPSAEEVTVEIYVNGQFLSGGNANYANAWAVAEGIAK